jgi:hypothetical protein
MVPRFDVRKTNLADDAFDVIDTDTEYVVIVNDLWLGAISYEDADHAVDMLNLLYAKREGLVN